MICLHTDPCLYILRFASKLEFGSKTQQVTNTALRLVQRMKRDSIHSGRRPSGLCGAALLIAARLHEFNRSVTDIVKVVKVHESTMRKRLIEFGDTPSSALTLEEFMTVDLEEEQDPPSFKAARKKDKERLQKVIEDEADNFSDLQKQIETHLAQTRAKSGSTPSAKLGNLRKLEQIETNKFINESTLGVINEIIDQSLDDPAYPSESESVSTIETILRLPSNMEDTSNALQPQESQLNTSYNLDDIDDEELDSYIMSEKECKVKNDLWHMQNADYLKKQTEKEEQLKKEREEGKPEKKPRKRSSKRSRMAPANSAGEAIEKIIQEKKISSKINYDVLKNLNTTTVSSEVTEIKEDISPTTSESIKRRRLSSVSSIIYEPATPKKIGKNQRMVDVGLPFLDRRNSTTVKEDAKENPVQEEINEEDQDEDFDEDLPDESTNEMGVLQMLQQHHEDEVGGGGDYDDYDDYGYDEYQ